MEINFALGKNGGYIPSSLGGRSISVGINIYIYYIKLKSHLSVCPSVLIFWHADISVVSALIETRLARNQSCAFGMTEFISTSLQNPPFINRSE